MMMDADMHGNAWMAGGLMVIMLLVVVFLITGIVFFLRNSRSR